MFPKGGTTMVTSGDGTLYNSVYNVTTKTFGTWNDSWSDTYNFSGWYEEGGKNIQRLDFYPSNVHDFNVAPSTPGSYQFQAKIKKKSNSTWWLESPTGSNYVVSFRVPGFTNTSVTHNVTVNKGSTRKFSVPYTHFGDNAPSSLSSAISGGLASNFTNYRKYTNSYVELELEVPLNTADGTYTSTFSVKEPYNKTNCSVTLNVTVTAPEPQVIIAEDPEGLPGPRELLSCFLKYTGCEDIPSMGFVYSKTAHEEGTLQVGAANCDTVNILAIDHSGSSYYNQGAHLRKTAYRGLERETKYYYRAFLYIPEPTVGSENYRYSGIGEFTTIGACVFEGLSEADTIYYTVDNTRETDICSLRFQSISDAVNDMKNPTGGSHDPWIDANGFLTRPIVVEVVKTATDYGDPNDHTRDVSLFNINGYTGSYTAPTVTTPSYRLTVRAKDPTGELPRFRGGFDMRRSRYITLKDLIIDYNYPNQSSHEYSALEFGHYPDSDAGNAPNHCATGLFTDTDIEIIGCEIDATGFNCIHACGCDGLKFDHCVFYMKGAGTGPNDRDWGASIKLMSCKNVQFTRNSITGSHSTLLWLQHTQNTLIMNSVFWNDNLFDDNVAFIRPMMFDPGDADAQKITNLGIYYNTFYLADRATSCSKLSPSQTCTSQNTEKVDFLRFGGPACAYKSPSGCNNQSENCTKYDVANIHFKYNNCYSYDTNIKKRNDDDVAFLIKTNCLSSLPAANFTYNNFWAKNDASPNDPLSTSEFAFGANAKHINVPNEVCRSTADNPDGLIVKGSSLSIGSRIQDNQDISGLHIANVTLADRLHEVSRPEDGSTWTYGAYQTAVAGDPVEVITWSGSVSSDWDDRENWKVSERETLNCTHSLSANLKVIIPDGGKVKNIPSIPAWSDGGRGSFPDEYVEAGLNSTSASSPTMFAKTIDLRDGAAIKGVEHLNEGGSPETLRYDEVLSKMVVQRDRWTLVGTMIKPFDTDGVRGMQSQDFYLNGVPQVYLRDAVVNDAGDEASWNRTYSDMFVNIPAQSAFALLIPNQYGKYFVTDEEYYQYFDTKAKVIILKTTPIEYTFYGRFYCENALPSYTGLTANKFNMVNNTYPANMDADELKKLSSVTDVQVYDSEDLSFGAYAEGDVIHPQQGFILKPSGTSVTITAAQAEDIFVGGTSRAVYSDYKSALTSNPYFGLRVKNLTATGGSKVKITLDELKDDSFIDGFDGTKVFNEMETTVPELYVMEYDHKLSSVTLPSFERIIPLGLRLKSRATVRFTLWIQDGIDSAVLEDRQTGLTTDISAGDVYTITLPAGTYEGRFFLNLGASDNEGEVITQVKESETANDDGISIYGNGCKVVISSPESVILKEAYIIDMAGKTVSTTLDNAHYNELEIIGSKGVYIIKAVADNASKTEKVIIK
ncbi:MAG: T9SS type A sorting domain-containing protein [Bacteroidales bacterium]|nr:T9SS type A sorting domain-containing protein [Bacteroidales bacterium]